MFGGALLLQLLPPALPVTAVRGSAAEPAPAPADQLAPAAYDGEPGGVGRGQRDDVGARLRLGADRTSERSQPRSSSKSGRSVGSWRSSDSTTGRSAPHSSAKAGGSAHTIWTSSAALSSG
ncbi:hypothetical protein Smic_50170 [Streptomyces microflavus]|uniref:Uncharacterized protein n=1 Tax=Streptomyces microflavus TaxID=1919 RepID=A0A7J0CV87_STRMI|nr:hypothetical protein Smic_50170 [Streptomyces microflavus]